jgi:hypothetical protein
MTAALNLENEKTGKMFSVFSFNSQSVLKEINEDGFLIHYKVPIARVGEFIYNSFELAFLFDENRDPNKKIKVYRDLDSFSDKVLSKNKIVPFTNDHPSGGVNIDNASYTVVGDVYNFCVEDGVLYADIITRDKDTIKNIEEDGKKEVSIGFEAKYTLLPKTIDGQNYDGLEEIVRINHLSLVNKGKAGSAFKMHAKQEEIPMSEKTFKTDFDGIEVDLPYEKLAEVQNSKFTKLEKQIQAKNSESEDRLTKMETMLNAIMQKVTKNADDEDKKDDKKDDDDDVENSDDEDDKDDKEMSKNGISNNSVSEVLKRRKPAQFDKLVVNTMDYPFLANQSHYIVSNESAADFEISPSAVLVSLRNYVTQQ